MASNLEFVPYKEFVEGLSEASEIALNDKSVISNLTDGPRKFDERRPADSLKNIENNSSVMVDVSSVVAAARTIATNVGIGNVVTLESVANGGWCCLIVECKKNDKFYLEGVGGSTPRLWCFVDEDNKVVSVAGAGASASAGITLFAPCDGKLIVNSITADLGKLLIPRNLSSFENKVEEKLAFTPNAFENAASGYIATNYGVGGVVSLTPISNAQFRHVVIDCEIGDTFELKGAGGSASRLWCFIDENNKVVSNSSADFVISGLTKLVAPCKGKFISNSNISASSQCFYASGFNALAEEFDEKIENTSDKVETLFEDAADLIDLAPCFVLNKTITTNVGVGNVVSLAYTTSNGWWCLIYPCKTGENFYLEGQAGDLPRLWCFIDENNKVVSVASANASATNGIKLEAPCNGKLIINSGYSYLKSFKVPFTYKSAVSLLKKSVVYGNTIDTAEKGYIVCNAGPGEEVTSLTPVVAGSWRCLVRNVKATDVFYIKGSGGGASRLWCFIDADNKVVSSAGADLVYQQETRIVAPCDGKLIFNTGAEDSVFRESVDTKEYVDEVARPLQKKMAADIKMQIPDVLEPFSQLPSYIANLPSNWPQKMFDIYDRFDALVSDYPDLIEKVDAAELVGMEYPAYANGVESGDPDYLETPAYKTYMYKVSNTNRNAGNEANFVKKKLLICAAVHGMEFEASVSAYSLVCHLLNNISNDLFCILSLFDIYVVPCVNGYGIIHCQRPNANNVDINRNFGTNGWTESGSVELGTWSGITPDSEFEVQLIEALYEEIAPDFAVDHHCTPGSNPSQFYTETASENILARSYDALVTLSNVLINEFPTYFGTSYHLFRDGYYAPSLPVGLSILQGSQHLWFKEHGIESATIEVMGKINYMGGEYDSTGTVNDDLRKINEFTLRNQLVKFLPIVLE